MSDNYILVNPYIHGNINTSFSANNHLDAAKKAYDTISEYFNNNIPTFHFTLQKLEKKKMIGGGRNNDYHHFKVTEVKKGSQVEFGITALNVIGNSNQMNKFRTELEKRLKIQDGGKKKKKKKYNNWEDDDSSSSSSSSSSDYRPKYRNIISQPMMNWYYDPYLYRINKYYIPTFVAPLAPYIEIPLYL